MTSSSQRLQQGASAFRQHRFGLHLKGGGTVERSQDVYFLGLQRLTILNVVFKKVEHVQNQTAKGDKIRQLIGPCIINNRLVQSVALRIARFQQASIP